MNTLTFLILHVLQAPCSRILWTSFRLGEVYLLRRDIFGFFLGFLYLQLFVLDCWPDVLAASTPPC